MTRSLVLLLPFALTTACTSVTVNRLTDEKLRRVPAKSVEQVSADEAKRRANIKVGSVDMRTHSPFAADLNALAKSRTGKLGGNAYVVTASESHTTMSGGFFSLFGDKSSASMSLDALRWQEQPASPDQAQQQPTKRKKRWFLF